MARVVCTEVDIDASPSAVWQELVNFSAYPDWNPFVRHISGDFTHGGRLAVTVAPPNNKEMRFKPLVLELEKERKFVWLGRFLMPGIFDGEHSFELLPLAGGKTRFVHQETFSGALVGMFWSRLDTDTRAGFNSMNLALKARCEAYAESAAAGAGQRGQA